MGCASVYRYTGALYAHHQAAGASGQAREEDAASVCENTGTPCVQVRERVATQAAGTPYA